MSQLVGNKVQDGMTVPDLSRPSPQVLESASKVERPTFLKALVRDAKERASLRGYAYGTILGDANDFTDAELSELDLKFIIRDGKVLVTECASGVHNILIRCLSEGLAAGLDAAMSDEALGSYRFWVEQGKELHYQHQYACTRKYKKISDFSVGIIRRHGNALRPTCVDTVVGEAAFRNESFNDLLIEGNEIVHHFEVDKLYSFLALIKENSEGSRIEYIRLVLLKAIRPNVGVVSETGKCLTPPALGSIEAGITTEDIVLAFPEVIVCCDVKYTLEECLDLSQRKIIELDAEDVEALHGVGVLFVEPVIEIDLTDALHQFAEHVLEMYEFGSYPNYRG